MFVRETFFYSNIRKSARHRAVIQLVELTVISSLSGCLVENILLTCQTTIMMIYTDYKLILSQVTLRY